MSARPKRGRARRSGEAASGEAASGGDLSGAWRSHEATEAMREPLASYLMALNQSKLWLGKLGAYVETENAFVDSEIEKVQSGGYLDFVHEIESQIVGML